jgi:hypothetical protein
LKFSTWDLRVCKVKGTCHIVCSIRFPPNYRFLEPFLKSLSCKICKSKDYVKEPRSKGNSGRWAMGKLLEVKKIEARQVKNLQ